MRLLAALSLLLPALARTPLAPAAAQSTPATGEAETAPPSGEAQDPDELEAQEALEEAWKLAQRGRYEGAQRRYRLLAERYPRTAAGRIAARRALPSAFVFAQDVVRHGPSSNRVDIVLMGEGYTAAHQKAWDKLAADVPGVFERQRCLGEYFGYFNFIRANLISAEDGVDGFGREYDTALNARTLATFAGHVGIDRERAAAMLDELPEHDGQAIIFVKLGILGTGGGGFATIGGRDIKTTIHEFGHSFGGLGDEYSTATHERGGVGRAPNVSDSEEPESLPWKHWLDVRGANVGAYEGASGQVRGAWKPTSSGCVMSSSEFFCRVCRERLLLRIYSFVDPIDECSPPAQPLEWRDSLRCGADGLRFELRTMQPASQRLEVEWWVLPEARAPRGGAQARDERYQSTGAGIGPRSSRGRLPQISAKSLATTRANRDGEHHLSLRLSDLEPGRYRVVARAHDAATPRGERIPWVLEDVDELLWSERAWWIEVPE